MDEKRAITDENTESVNLAAEDTHTEDFNSAVLDTEDESEIIAHYKNLGFIPAFTKHGRYKEFSGIKKCSYNLKRYIEYANILQDIRYNDFADYAEREKGSKWQRINDLDLLELITRIEQTARAETGENIYFQVIAEWKIDKGFMNDYITEHAKRVNPVKDYLSSLKWDEIPRIDTLLHDVFKANQDKYTSAAMWLFLLGIISRVYNPGMKFDYMLVLQGRQGIGKSTFLKKLAINPEWYGTIGAAHMQDTKLLGEDAAGKIILEYEELDGIRKTTAEKLKATISRDKDQYRKAYSVLSEDNPRKYVLSGTTNKGQYLSDETGNRRYLPIIAEQAGSIMDGAGFISDTLVSQIWAEAFEKWQKLTANDELKLRLSAAAESLANEYREESTGLICDDYIDDIREYLYNVPTPAGEIRTYTTVLDMYCYMQGQHRPLGDLSIHDARKIIVQALRVEKWENKLVKEKGKVSRVYAKPL